MKNDIIDILKKADDLKQKGKLFKAIALYEAILPHVGDLELLSWLRITLADLYFWVKDFAKAKKFVLDNIAQNPLEPFNYYYFAFLLIGEGNLLEAKKNFEKAYMLDPSNPEYLRGLGWIEFLFGNYNEAEKILREVLRRDSDNSAARDNLIELLIKIGNLEEAEKEINNFREKDPKDWQIYYRLQELKNKKKEFKK
ncbi:MAG: tetratricopeptide repeat protein [Dictyoglomus sp.]